MKLRKNIIYIVLIIILCFFTMCSCNIGDDFRNPINGEPEAGKFYSLQEAFDNGWLSRGDLRNIAYHRTGDGQRKGFKPTPKNPETLSAETESAIKEYWAEQHMDDEFYSQIISLSYYGKYNGLIVAFIKTGAQAFCVIVEEEIGGIKFQYPDGTHKIYVWKPIEQ